MSKIFDYLALMPWRITHNFVCYVFYGKTGKYIKLGERNKWIGEVLMHFPTDLSPHITLMYLGVYEYPVRRLFTKVLKQGDVFVDIGANIGYFSAIAMNCVGPAGKVLAFEPDTRCLESLYRLRDENLNYSLKIENKAVSNKMGTLLLHQTTDWGTSTLLPNLRTERNLTGKIRVQTVRMDDYLKSNKIFHVKLIKIDVEGNEMRVLNGMTGFLRKCDLLPIIMVEIYPHAMRLQGYSLFSLQDWLDKFGYVVQGRRGVTDLMTTPNDMYNLVLVPRP